MGCGAQSGLAWTVRPVVGQDARRPGLQIPADGPSVGVPPQQRALCAREVNILGLSEQPGYYWSGDLYRRSTRSVRSAIHEHHLRAWVVRNSRRVRVALCELSEAEIELLRGVVDSSTRSDFFDNLDLSALEDYAVLGVAQPSKSAKRRAKQARRAAREADLVSRVQVQMVMRRTTVEEVAAGPRLIATYHANMAACGRARGGPAPTFVNYTDDPGEEHQHAYSNFLPFRMAYASYAKGPENVGIDPAWSNFFAVLKDKLEPANPSAMASMLRGLNVLDGPSVLILAECCGNEAGEWRDCLPMVKALLLIYSLMPDVVEFDSTPYRFCRRAIDREYTQTRVIISPRSNTTEPKKILVCCVPLDTFVNMMSQGDTLFTNDVTNHSAVGQENYNPFNFRDIDGKWVIVPISGDRALSAQDLLALAAVHVGTDHYNGRVNWVQKLSYEQRMNGVNNTVDAWYASIPAANSWHCAGASNLMFVLTKTNSQFISANATLLVGTVSVPIYSGRTALSDAAGQTFREQHIRNIGPEWEARFSTANIGPLAGNLFAVYQYLTETTSTDEACATASAIAAELAHVLPTVPTAEPIVGQAAYQPNLNGAWAFGEQPIGPATRFTCSDILDRVTIADNSHLGQRMTGYNFATVSPNQIPAINAVRTVINVSREVEDNQPDQVEEWYVTWADDCPPVGTQQYVIPCSPSYIRLGISAGFVRRSPKSAITNIIGVQGTLWMLGASQAGSAVCMLTINDLPLREWQGWGMDSHPIADSGFDHLYKQISNNVFRHNDPLPIFDSLLVYYGANCDLANSILAYHRGDVARFDWGIFSSVPTWFYAGWDQKIGYVWNKCPPPVLSTDSVKGDAVNGVITVDPENYQILSIAASCTIFEDKTPCLQAYLIDDQLNGVELPYPVDQFCFLGSRPYASSDSSMYEDPMMETDYDQNAIEPNDLYLHKVAQFYLKLESECIVPVNTIQKILDEMMELHDASRKFMKNKLCEKLASENFSEEKVNTIFDEVFSTDPISEGFEKLASDHFRKKFWRKEYDYVPPQFLETDKEKKTAFAYVPILETIKFEDLKKLEKGIEINGEVIRGTVVHIAGDNLGSHGLGGFLENFSSAEYFCRFCHISRVEFEADGGETKIFEWRSVESYENAIREIGNRSSHQGIKFNSEFNELQYYHVISGLPPGHDLFEGFIAFDLKVFIDHFVSKKWFSVQQLNKRIKDFPYSAEDKQDQPCEVTERKHRLTGGACQIWNFVRLFPVLVVDKVRDIEDEVWLCVLLMTEIVEMICAPSIHDSQIAYLDELICHYLEKRRSLFPLIKLRPKHHYLRHCAALIRLFDRLIKVWAMRFESKHRYFKRLVRILLCFKSVIKTASLKNELYQSYVRLGGDLRLTLDVGKTNDLNVDLYHQDIVHAIMRSTTLEGLEECGDLIYKGVKYKRGDVMAIRQENYQCMVIFGRISLILCRDKSDVYFLFEVLQSTMPHFRVHTVRKLRTTFIQAGNIEQIVSEAKRKLEITGDYRILLDDGRTPVDEDFFQWASDHPAVVNELMILPLLPENTDNARAGGSQNNIPIQPGKLLRSEFRLASSRPILHNSVYSSSYSWFTSTHSTCRSVDVDLILSKVSAYIVEHLSEGTNLTRDRKSEVARDMRDYTMFDLRDTRYGVARKLSSEMCERFPTSFSKQLENNVWNDGVDSLTKSVYNGIMYKNHVQRNNVHPRQVDSDEEEINQRRAQREQNRRNDSYGCAEYAPDLPDGETPESQESKRSELLKLLTAADPRNAQQKERLVLETYSTQRTVLNALDTDLQTVFVNWPFLK
ncbi:hypothetical protein QAD02_005325 [Eretmocerus hayati]|uniref:Uncharacterized protein n=1 Tax=Eretmocerus hayati TaxID=131215 RepID=A0ACC2NS77_9HYME|nr:hypothetical protein QAD02_005325 [Eretmocerus hayati]